MCCCWSRGRGLGKIWGGGDVHLADGTAAVAHKPRVDALLVVPVEAGEDAQSVALIKVHEAHGTPLRLLPGIRLRSCRGGSAIRRRNMTVGSGERDGVGV